jgi:hypothetical protein
LYTGIVAVFLIALPTLLLPPKFTLLFGKFLGHYVVFIVKIFLNTKVEFKGIDNIPKTEKYFVASAHQSMFSGYHSLDQSMYNSLLFSSSSSSLLSGPSPVFPTTNSFSTRSSISHSTDYSSPFSTSVSSVTSFASV